MNPVPLMELVELVRGSQFAQHVRGVLLQGIAVAGFNVVDVHGLHTALGVPVLITAAHWWCAEAMSGAKAR